MADELRGLKETEYVLAVLSDLYIHRLDLSQISGDSVNITLNC